MLYSGIRDFGAIPSYIVKGERLWTLLTSMFMHADIMHLLGNMVYLWIFGDNVEDALGHIKYLLFYLFGGLIAGLTHIISLFITLPSFGLAGLEIPTVGASGAIFGVLAAFAVLFPFRWLVTLFGFIPVPVPAIILVFLMITAETAYAASGGIENIAHTAHIGGFLAGVFLTLLFGPKRRKPEENGMQKLSQDLNQKKTLKKSRAMTGC